MTTEKLKFPAIYRLLQAISRPRLASISEMLGEPRAGARKPGTASGFIAVLASCLFAICGLGVGTAQGAGGEGRSPVVVHSVHSRPHLRAFWTPRRMRQAKPLSLITLSRSGGETVQADDASPAAANPLARGTDTGDSTQYPNSANGIVYGFYDDPVDPFAYQCSGSVINTPTGNVVLTAGHCVIDADTGTLATDLIFVPGFRDFDEPYGEWTAPTFATTSQWQSTAGEPIPNEGGDMAMLTLDNRPSDSATLQSVVGAVGIAFNQPRVQTYMEYGYPAQFPYDGTRLYELTSPWGRDDLQFSPNPMGISSDFTGGSSGGPWLVGNAPLAESVSDYIYVAPAPASWRGYMYGPYFGSIAQNLFVTVGGSVSGSSATGTIAGPTNPTNAPISPASGTPSNAVGIELLSRNRHRGVAVLGVNVPGAGKVGLSGDGLRPVTKEPDQRRTVALRVRARGSALSTLRDAGRVLVQATIAYTPSGGSTNSKTRSVVLLKHP
jgi:V8-like Glu-specific endopeptidase